MLERADFQSPWEILAIYGSLALLGLILVFVSARTLYERIKLNRPQA